MSDCFIDITQEVGATFDSSDIISYIQDLTSMHPLRSRMRDYGDIYPLSEYSGGITFFELEGSHSKKDFSFRVHRGALHIVCKTFGLDDLDIDWRKDDILQQITDGKVEYKSTCIWDIPTLEAMCRYANRSWRMAIEMAEEERLRVGDPLVGKYEIIAQVLTAELELKKAAASAAC